MAFSFGVANYDLANRFFGTLSITFNLGQELTDHFQLIEELGAASSLEGDQASAAIGVRWVPFAGSPLPSTFSPHFFSTLDYSAVYFDAMIGANEQSLAGDPPTNAWGPALHGTAGWLPLHGADSAFGFAFRGELALRTRSALGIMWVLQTRF